MTPDSHEERLEHATLYVLGALPADARAEFESHLASCDVCAAEVRQLATVTDVLALGAPPVDPPEALRARVLASATGRAPRARLQLSWLAAAASLVVAVGIGGYAVELRARVATLESRLREAALRAEAADRQIADARRAAGEAQTTVAVLVAPDLARIDLAGQVAAPQARARAFWSRSRGLVFNASDLPALPQGRVYQLWVVTAQAPLSAGLLQPDATGRVSAVIETPADIPTPVAMAVTIEPLGGVPAPTGEKFLVGAVGL